MVDEVTRLSGLSGQNPSHHVLVLHFLLLISYHRMCLFQVIMRQSGLKYAVYHSSVKWFEHEKCEHLSHGKWEAFSQVKGPESTPLSLQCENLTSNPSMLGKDDHQGLGMRLAVMIEELVKQSPPWVGGLQGAGRAVEQ